MNVEAILANYDFSQVQVLKSIAPLLLAGLIVGAISLAVGIYTFLQMRKMQKKNRPKPNQIDGTIADEGVSFMDIAGSPHVHPNITDLWNKKSEAIKQKSGGFLGIGKTSQVTGYRYYTSFAAFIGNRIEKFIAINFDNRGWIVHDPTKHPFNMLPVNKPSLFGQDAGGVVGNIDIEFGYPQPQQNLAYKQHFDLVSAYPYQSYLVFRGTGESKSNEGGLIGGVINALSVGDRDAFYFGNSNYMKEMLLWVKRIHVCNDGQAQWHDSKSEILENGVFKSSTNETLIKLVGNRDVPAGVPINISTTVIGGEYGVFDNVRETIFTKNGSGLIIPQSELDRFSVGNVFSEGDLTYVYFDDRFERVTANLDHADNLDPNWGVHAVTPIPSVVTIASVGFDSIYFIDIRSRIELIDFSVKFSSPYSYIFTSRNVQYSGSVGLGFNEGVLLSIVLARGDTAIVSYKTKNKFYPDYLNGVIRSQATVYATNMELSASSADIDSPDINPIHKIREILTDDTAMAKPEHDINDANFTKAADRIYDEGLGVSWAIDEKSCIDAIEELCYHIEAGIRVNRQTGLHEMVLFRDDWFTEDEIHTIAENKIKDLSLEVMNSDDIVNQLNVTYYDRKRIKNSTFSIYENGSILTMGKANAESIEFPYFMNMRNAEVVANWKLKQYSTPAWKGTFTTGWREARKWNRYDLVKINWSKKWQGTILARIMKIDLGNGLNNEVMIDFEEVVPYSGEMNTSIVVDDSTETKPMPPQSAIFKTFEIPYYDLAQLKTQTELDLELARNPNIGFVAVVAGRPQQNSIDAQFHTESDVGYELVSNVEYASFARTDGAVNRTQQSFVVKNEDLSVQFRQDSLIMLGDEIAIYKSYDAETKTLTVERGALDTIPQNHIENTVLYFYDDALAYDSEGYTPPKTVNATVLTTTPSGIEPLETSPKRQIEIESRAIRPYPPANVKINGEYFPDDIETDLVITWSDRNRLNLNIIDWYSPSVTIEQNIQTHLIISQLDENQIELATSNANVTGAVSFTMPILSMQANTRFVKVTLKTMRDGFDCLNPFVHTIELSEFFSAPYDLTVEFKNE